MKVGRRLKILLEERKMLLFMIYSTLFLVTLLAIERATIRSGDTEIMANASVELVKCAQNETWSNCAGAAGAPFGLLQFAPALFLAWKGMSPTDIVLSLGLLSLIAFFSTCIVIMRLKSINLVSRTFVCLMLISGPLIGYAPASFGESLAVFVWVCFVISLLFGHWTTVFAFSLIAVTWRESAILTIAPIGCSLLLHRYYVGEKIKWKEFFAFVSGIFTGFGCVCLLNIWRYGTWKNVGYLNPEFRTPGLALPLRVFGSLWFSPSGGVLVIWFLAALVSVVVPILVISSSDKLFSVKNISPMLILLVPLGQSLLLSKWFSPFGWISWGPRTMIPTIAISSFACCLAYPYALAKLTRLYILIPLVTLSLISLGASLGYLNRPSEVMADFLTPNTSCPTMPVLQLDRDYYFRCLEAGIWNVDHSMLSAGWRGISGVSISVAFALYAACYLLLILSRKDFEQEASTEG